MSVADPQLQLLSDAIAQRDAELAVIDSVQRAIGAALDFQAIVDLVGDKLREVFGTGDLGILWWDEGAGHADWLGDVMFQGKSIAVAVHAVESLRR